jgi:hypothetical protein
VVGSGDTAANTLLLAENYILFFYSRLGIFTTLNNSVMKKIFLGLALAGLGMMTACSNGDYTANPSGNTNGSVNPVTPLTSGEYTWGGADPMSVYVNGSYWTPDWAGAGYPDSTGGTTIGGVKGSRAIVIYVRDMWGGNVYNTGYNSTYRWVAIADSMNGVYDTAYSYLGNSAGTMMVKNDSSGYKGLFYAKCVSKRGNVVNLSQGYFNLSRP